VNEMAKKVKTGKQKKYMWIFRNGKRVRIKRPPTIDGVELDEFIRRNADPIWLHQNEIWEYMDEEPERSDRVKSSRDGDVCKLLPNLALPGGHCVKAIP